MAQHLTDYLDAIPDPRRGAGQRHNKTFILLLTLMATMSGYVGYRAIGDFIQRNRSELLQRFRPHKNRLPTFYTVRRLLMELDFEAFSAAFYQWASTRIKFADKEWLSMDGKVMAGTITDSRNTHQRFLMLVSLYCARQGLSVAATGVDNSKQGEADAVRRLVASLQLKGTVFTLDAIHCQKKPVLTSATAAMTTSLA